MVELTANYSIYILRCSDGSLYTGIATDVDRRLEEHKAGKRGAKYLRGRWPATVVFRQAIGDRSCASRVERRVKKLPRSRKEQLIDGLLKLESLMSGNQASGSA